MKSVEDLDVFKLAHQLALNIYAVTGKFPKEETFSLVNHISRAQGVKGLKGAKRLERLERLERSVPADSRFLLKSSQHA